MPEFLIKIVDGKLAVRTNPDPSLFDPWNPASFPFRSPPRESQPIDRFLIPEFVSRLAAKLWQGDSVVCVSEAITLIHECSEGLALRTSPFWNIGFGGPQSVTSRSTARFWKNFPLESIIEIAATAAHSKQPEGAAATAFSIIENARAALEKKSKPPSEEQRNNPAAVPDRRSLRKNLAYGLLENSKPHWAWREAAKRVTGIKRLKRAENTFLRFLMDPSVCDKASLSNNILKRTIDNRKKQGLSLDEVRTLENAFKNWHRRWIRSRQSDSGKRIGQKNLRKKS
jgi:hypothetical protein